MSLIFVDILLKMRLKTAFPLSYIEKEFTEIFPNAEFIELSAG